MSMSGNHLSIHGTTTTKRTRTAVQGHEDGTDETEEPTTGSSKRPRAIVSCAECSRRKQKCDRKEPCSQCVRRKIPHLCLPVAENGREEDPMPRLETRMANMERMMKHMMSMLSPGSAALQEPADRGTDSRVSGSAGGWGPSNMRRIHLDASDNASMSSMLESLEQSGVQRVQIERLIAAVPGKRLSDGLVDLYFRDINWTRYPIHQPSFRKHYNALFHSLSQRPLNPHLDVHVLCWLPTFFSVLTIAAHEAPDELISASQHASWTGRLYESTRTSIDIGKALHRDSLDLLNGAILMSRYTLMIRRAAEGGIPLSLAFPLGLYRDGSILHLTNKREIEIRRRTWAMLYHLDRSISLLIGRPPIISDAHTDTQSPANLEDEELEADFDPAGHPLTQPTVWTYFVVRHDMAKILGRIAYHTFAVKQPVYQTVLDLDSELLAWQQSLPAFLSMTNPDRSQDHSLPYLSLQRHLLACEWHYARVILHRPYLLRRGPHEGYFVYSQNAAVDSAREDLLNRRDFIMEKGTFVNSGGYRLLDSIMVLAVIMNLEPDTPRARELKDVISIVTARQPDSNGRVSEPLGQDDMATIEVFTAPSTAKKQTPPEANVRDEQLHSLVGNLMDSAASSSISLLATGESNEQPTESLQTASAEPIMEDGHFQRDLASWASMFEQSSDTGRTPGPVNVARPSATFLDEFLGGLGTHQSFVPSTVPGESTEQRFNPFALAQQGNEPQMEDPQVDEQTQLFNLLLSVIANQQPVGQ